MAGWMDELVNLGTSLRTRKRGLHYSKCGWRICDLILAANVKNIGKMFRKYIFEAFSNTIKYLLELTGVSPR